MSRMPFRGAPGAGGELAGGPLQRARIALMNNQPAIAEEIARRRLEKKPDDYVTRLLLAQALIQMQRGREGMVEARRVLDSQPNSVDALLLLSSALLTTGNQFSPPREALVAAQRAVQLQPKNARARVQLAEVLMMQRQYAQAQEEADEAVKLEPKLAAAHMIKGMSFLNSKNFEGAAQAFQAALRQDRTMAQAQLGLAQALAELKRPDEAMQAVDAAQKLNPAFPPGQMAQLRAQIFRKQRKYGAAYGVYLGLARKNSRNPRFAPFSATMMFAFGILGQVRSVVAIVVVVALVLFGLSRIPKAGGVLVDVVIVGLLSLLIWQSAKVSLGVSLLQRLMNPRALGTAAAGLLVGMAVVFGIFAFIGRGQHHNYWFNPLSFGIAAFVGLFAVLITVTAGPGAKRA